MPKSTSIYQMTGGAVEVEAMPQALYNRLYALYRAKNPAPQPPMVHVNQDDPESAPIYEANTDDIRYLRAVRDYELTWISRFASAVFRRCVRLQITDEQRDIEIKNFVDQYNQDFDLEMTVEELVGDDPHSFYISTILSENETETAMLYEYVIQNTSFVSREEINQRRLLF